jgi:branched-chain amino acid transport system substrate-binding protein
MEKAMLRNTPKAPALNTKLALGFAGVLMLGIATMMPAHAQIKIGFQAPLTGPSATDGKSAQIAATMAVEDINAAGGVLGQKIELVSWWSTAAIRRRAARQRRCSRKPVWS